MKKLNHIVTCFAAAGLLVLVTVLYVRCLPAVSKVHHITNHTSVSSNLRDNGAFVDADDDDDDDDFFRRCFDNFTCSSVETKLDPHKYIIPNNISPCSDRLLYDHQVVAVFPLRI